METEALRREMADRFRLTVEHGRLPEPMAFRRALACEMLKRRGLTRPEIGEVLCLTRRGVDQNLHIISSRMRSGSGLFKRYIDNLAVDPAEHYLNAALGRWGVG
jgi:hypothetical protein